MKNNIFLISLVIISFLTSLFFLSKHDYIITDTFKSICRNLKPLQNTETAFYSYENYIFIPITINGQTFRFLWDTGYSYSTISENFAKNISVKKTSTTREVATLQTKKIEIDTISEKIEWSIKSLKLNSQFTITDYFHFLPNHSLDGIIGQDIISQFCWFFDLINSTVQISSKPIKIEEEPSFSLNLLYSDASYCNILFNDTISSLIFFDTGMDGILSRHENKQLKYDFMLISADTVNSLWSYLHSLSISQKSKHIFEKPHITNQDTIMIPFCAIIDSLKIDDFEPFTTLVMHDVNDFYRSKEKQGISGVITTSFLKRFSKMYYDPFNKIIKFYKSDNDKGLYTGQEIYEFMNSATKK